MNRIFRGYLFVILSAILFGCLPLAANIAYDNGLNSLSLVFYRNLFALPILYLPIRLRGEPLRVSRQEFTNILPLSILGFCITPALLFTSYNYLPAGTSTTFHFIYPAMTILGGVVLFRQKGGGSSASSSVAWASSSSTSPGAPSTPSGAPSPWPRG